MAQVLQQIINEFDLVDEFIFHLVIQVVLQGQTIQRISSFSHFKQAGERKTIYLLLEVDVFQPKGINCIPSLIVILT